jgi:hypothetical protein
MIGAQVAVLMSWAGFGERHRSRRRPVDHDFLDPLRAVALGSRRRRHSTTTRLNRSLPDRLEGDAISQRPNTGARPRSRLNQMAAPLLSRSDAVGCPEWRRRPRNEDGSNWAAPWPDRPALHRHRAPALHRAAAHQAAGFANSAARPLRGSADQREIERGFRGSRNGTRQSTAHYDQTGPQGVE